MGVNEMHLKILLLLCRLGLVLRVGSVYVALLAVTVWWRYVSPSHDRQQNIVLVTTAGRLDGP